MKIFFKVSMSRISLFMALVLLTIFSACAKTPEIKPKDQNSSITQASTKFLPKSLTFYQKESDSYDPAYASTMDFANVGQGVFEGLVKYKKNSTEVEPSLAVSWEISPDMKVYKFALRKDVKFHDGSKFNADSVLYSFERQMKDKRSDDMSYANFIFDEVAKIEKLDEYTVQITLINSSVTFLTNLAMYFGSPIINQDAHKKNPTAYAQNPSGTGPYKMVKHEKGKVIELDINNNYWGEKPKIDKISFLLEEKTVIEKTNELSNGKIDLLILGNESEINKLNPEKFMSTKVGLADIFYIAFNCAKAPFNNRNFREGISHLINRDEVIKKKVNISGEKAETLIPPSVLGFNSKVKAYDYDISKATKLLNNFPNDKELSIIYSFDAFTPLGKIIVDNLAKMGIKAKHELLKGDAFSKRLETNNYDMVIDAWQSDNGDPDNFVFLLSTSSIEGGLNSAKYSNPELDAMIGKGKKTLKIDERSMIYQKAEELISKEVPIIPLYHGGANFAFSKNIKNFYVHPAGVLGYLNFDKQ